MTQFNTLQEARAALSQRGVNLSTKAVQRGLDVARNKARYDAQQAASETTNPKAASLITSFINRAVIVVVAVTALTLVLSIVGLFVVEVIAVYDGLYLVLGRWKAAVAAVVILSAYYTLMFISESLNTTHDNSEPQFSLALWRERLRYFVGRGVNNTPWAVQMKENADYRNALDMQRFVLWCIVFLSVFGRLSPILLQTTDIPASEGLQYLLSQTSLIEWLSTFGIGLTTFVTLGSSHYLYAFTYKSFVRITGGLDLGKSPASYEALSEQLTETYQLQYLTDLYNRKAAQTETN